MCIESSLGDKLLYIKKCYFNMLKERDALPVDSLWRPNDLWLDAIQYLSFISELSPEHLLNIRLHTGFLTGVSWFVHAHKSYRFFKTDEEKQNVPLIQSFNYYTDDVPEQYWTDEPVTTQMIEAAGVRYKGHLVTDDTVRYQSAITNLYNMGVFRDFARTDKIPVIVEIGGGYGGFAHQFCRVMQKKSLYIVLDIPETLFWSATYFTVNNRGKSVYIYDKNTFTPDFFAAEAYKYDVIFLPNFMTDSLYEVKSIDLLVNMLSFQEMSELQIRQYAKLGNEKLDGYIYSDNFRKHWVNQELDKNVACILREYFLLFPSEKFYNEDMRDEIQRINCLCKHFGVSLKKLRKIQPVRDILMGNGYKASIND